MPLYPVYVLLFADSGLDGRQIASLLVLWSLVSLLGEVPSGALADRVPRRHLLVAAALIRATGFALWVAIPGYAAFAVGFALWGAASALSSGTFEALTYEELRRLGAADHYAVLRSRSGVAALLAELAATVAAAPLFALGGYLLLGAVSVAGCLVQVAVLLRLPRGEPTGDPEAESYFGTLTDGVREAVTRPAVRRLVLCSALLAGLCSVDEFIPLLARAAGASDPMVPLLVATFVLAAAAGTWAAGRLAGASGTVAALITGAVLVTAGSLAGGVPALVALVGWYAAVQLGMVVVDVRLQDSITGTSRATVTSVAGLGAECAAMLAFAGYGLALDSTAPETLLLVGVVVPTALVAGAMARALRNRVDLSG